MSVLHTDQAMTAFAQTLPVGRRSWNRIFPVVLVEKMSDKYYTFGREELFTGDVQTAARGTVANESDQSQTTSTYNSYKYRHAMRLTDEELANQDVAIRAQYRRTRQCFNKVQDAAEKRAKTVVYTSGSYGSTGAATASWLTATWAQIEKDVQDGIEALAKTGPDPTHIVIPVPFLYAIKRAQEAIRMYTDATLVQQAIIGESVPFLGLQLIAPGGVTNSANPGQTASYGRIWVTTSAIVAIARIVENPGLDEATWTSCFRWKNFATDNGSGGEQAISYKDPKTQVTFVEYDMHQTEDVTSSACAYGITGV